LNTIFGLRPSISVTALEGTGPALLDIFFLLLVSEENDAQNNGVIIEDSLNLLRDYFRDPVYLWPLAKKRAFLILATLSRWNPTMGTLFQDQLILMTGLDIGSTKGPNGLRAATIAIRRNLGIAFVAQGNGVNRRYIFENNDLRAAVAALVSTYPWKDIHQLLLDELSSHRRRRY
tara:strand:+ start:201 stop:725 length:525 start_codon:yes stop_codon:yes gene_type:complete